MRRGGRPRPKGKCQLCGKLVWGPAVVFDNGVRHPACIPGGRAVRYHIGSTEKGRST